MKQMKRECYIGEMLMLLFTFLLFFSYVSSFCHSMICCCACRLQISWMESEFHVQTYLNLMCASVDTHFSPTPHTQHTHSITSILPIPCHQWFISFHMFTRKQVYGLPHICMYIHGRWQTNEQTKNKNIKIKSEVPILYIFFTLSTYLFASLQIVRPMNTTNNGMNIRLFLKRIGFVRRTFIKRIHLYSIGLARWLERFSSANWAIRKSLNLILSYYIHNFVSCQMPRYVMLFIFLSQRYGHGHWRITLVYNIGNE